MKKILVPTDFSENAFIAARYAASLAATRNWQVSVCHIYRPFYSAFQSESLNKRDKDNASTEAEAKLGKFLGELSVLHPEVNLHGQCVVGSVVEEICRQACSPETALIVMGTLGATGLRYALLGSNTFAIIQETALPVLAVPKNIKNFNFQKVGFTTDFHAIEITGLHDFLSLMEQPLEIIPFHLYTADKPAVQSKMKTWKSKVDKMIGAKTTEVKLVRMREHTSGIQSFIRKEMLDALVMTRIQKGFLDRIMGRNLIKAVVHQCPIPVMFIPES